MVFSITACGKDTEPSAVSSEKSEIRENFTNEDTKYSSNKVNVGEKISAYKNTLELREEKDESTGYVNVFADIDGESEPLLLFQNSEGLVDCYMIDSGKIAYVIAQANFMDHETKDTWYALQLIRLSENGVSQTNTIDGKLVDKPVDGMTEFNIRSEVGFCGYQEADRTYYIQENYLIPKESTYRYVNKQKISPLKDITFTTTAGENLSYKTGDELYITAIDIADEDDSVKNIVYMEDSTGKSFKIEYTYEYFEMRINNENVEQLFSYE